jgi:hypothetical protein
MQSTIKFNGGKLAKLCARCRRVVKTGVAFSEKERLDFLKGEKIVAEFCGECARVLEQVIRPVGK